jgi:uncharacterized protein CbrC (UPF0167 family)
MQDKTAEAQQGKGGIEEDKMICQECGKRRPIFRKGKCYPCYQEELDKLVSKGIISKESASLWRTLGVDKK